MQKRKFPSLFEKFSIWRVLENFDKRIWSLQSTGKFLVKRLTAHLSPSSPLNKSLYKALWKTKSPRRVNVVQWIMIFGLLNCSYVMQGKFPSSCLSPSISLCKKEGKELQHLFFACTYSANCW